MIRPTPVTRHVRIAAGVDRGGRVTVPVPFDRDEAWGAEPHRHVAGKIGRWQPATAPCTASRRSEETRAVEPGVTAEGPACCPGGPHTVVIVAASSMTAGADYTMPLRWVYCRKP